MSRLACQGRPRSSASRASAMTESGGETDAVPQQPGRGRGQVSVRPRDRRGASKRPSLQGPGREDGYRLMADRLDSRIIAHARNRNRPHPPRQVALGRAVLQDPLAGIGGHCGRKGPGQRRSGQAIAPGAGGRRDPGETRALRVSGRGAGPSSGGVPRPKLRSSTRSRPRVAQRARRWRSSSRPSTRRSSRKGAADEEGPEGDRQAERTQMTQRSG